MAMTAAIRNMVFALLVMLAATPAVQGVIEFLATAGIVIDQDWLWVAAGAISIFIAGLITYVINKLGSRWSFINMIMSLGRAKTGATYIPSNQETITVTTTPPGESTLVVSTNEAGKSKSTPI